MCVYNIRVCIAVVLWLDFLFMLHIMRRKCSASISCPWCKGGMPTELRKENKHNGVHGCRHQHGYILSHTHGYTHTSHTKDNSKKLFHLLTCISFLSWFCSVMPLSFLVRCYYKFITSFNQPHRMPLLALSVSQFLNPHAPSDPSSHPNETVIP